MRTRTGFLTPLASVGAGLLAGVAGTVSMDTARYRQYRHGGGQQGFLEWEFPAVANWAQAPDPGQVAKRVIEGFTQRELPDRWAWLTSTLAHWSYGTASAGAYGVLAGSLRRPRAWYGLPFGAGLFATSYLVLPAAGIYKPIREYDKEVLARDLAAHLAYGAGTGVAFTVLTKMCTRS